MTQKISFSVFILMLSTVAEGSSQIEGDTVLEQIIVTANRRSENLQDISTSITALTSEDIRQRGLDDLQGFARMIPGVVLHEALKNRSTFTIRGLNTDTGDTQLTQEPVSLYINDMPVVQPYAALVQPDLRLYDVERIEVLRGPQGTLFGSGSLGGTVRIHTRQPDSKALDASLRIDAADTNDAGMRYRYDAMVNVPLVDNELALRIVGYVRREAGWVENVTLGTDNSSDDWGYRFGLAWTPVDDFSARLEYFRQNSEPDDSGTWDPALGKFNRASIFTEGRKANLQLLNLTLEYDFKFAQLISSTNFQETDSSWFVQRSNIPGIGPIIIRSDVYDTELFAQEVRLVSDIDQRINWVAGFFYVESSNRSPVFFGVDGLQDFVNDIVFPGYIQSDALFETDSFGSDTDETAVFFDATYKIDEQWSVSAGIRAFRTESRYQAAEGYAFDFGLFAPIVEPAVDNSGDDSATTWRTVLSYTPTSSVRYYLSLSKGFRVGQVNPNFGSSLVDPTDIFIPATYESDETLNFEFGIKSRWLEDRLQLNAALYRIDWTDIQVDATRQSDSFNYIANAGNAISEGIEIELQALPTDDLIVNLSITHQRAEIDEINAIQSINSGALLGDVMPGTADWLASISLQHHWQLTQAEIRSRLDYQYVGESPNRFSNASVTQVPHPDFSINESYTNLNLSMSYVVADWELTVYIENATNNDSVILNTGVTLGNQNVSLRPRTMGARFEYFF